MSDSVCLESAEGNIMEELTINFETCVGEMDLKSETEDIKDSTLDKLAIKLLKYNFILTALEFHTELVESGRELPRLRDYFSNPGNFEKHLQETETSPVLPRTSSVQTFDSLDFTRYSDDGERQVDERVAVLEFELRKAKETIKALRTNLTVATESDPNTPTCATAKSIVQDAVKPHEKRALNFLVNEYLLNNSYKLTSITFSDENDDQDFEDWDDVGLNIPKPPNLLQLYRNFSRYMYLHNDVSTKMVQTDRIALENDESNSDFRNNEKCKQEQKNLLDQITKLIHEKDELAMIAEEKENLALEVKSLKRELKMFKMNSGNTGSENAGHTLSGVGEDMKSVDSSDTQEYVIVGKQVDNSPVSVAANDSFTTFQVEPNSETVNKNVDMLNAHSNSYTELSYKVERNISQEFQKTLFSLCQSQKIAQDNRVINEVSDIVNSQETVIMMLARCLPHIVPNILLAKREELIPLILCAIALHPDPKQRDKLLNILFNLIKRPDEEQRQMILTGLVAIAQHLGPSRVEAELLPQCWEQITHRYVERRLLVAESCGVLAPYVMSGIRSSLLLSMLQQMLQEDKDDLVRETVVKNLALLLLYVYDMDKFPKACELLFSSLEDRSLNVIESGLNVLLPSIAVWALELDLLESQLFLSVMTVLDNYFKVLNDVPLPVVVGTVQNEEQQCILLVRAVSILSPFLFVSVIMSGPYAENLQVTSCSPSEVDVDRLPVYPSPLIDPAVVVGDGDKLLSLIKSFDKYISSEWYKPWEKHDWIINEFLPWLHTIFGYVNSQRQMVLHALVELMHSFCHLFGRPFTQKNIKPSFLSRLSIGEEEKNLGTAANRSAYQDATVPVYVAGVLAALHQAEDRQELLEFLQDLLCTVSLYHLPDCSIKAALAELSTNKAYHELLLSVLWDGVVHNSSFVRVTAGRLFEILVGVVSENLLRTRVTPALVTLASDPEIVVRIATVPALGAIMELSSQKDLLEKVHLQLQTFLDDPMYWDQHLLHVEVIRTFAKVGPNTEPKFRDEFVLPRLAALAAKNNSTTNETKKMDIALALLEAYTAMSCCFMSDQLIAEAFLPGLHCLKSDFQVIAHEYEDAINSMIQEFEAKLDVGRSVESRPNSLSISSTGGMEEMRNRMTKIFTSRQTGARPNIQNLFQLRKK
ncbi:RAB11-binding protein RELCH homolog isoform X2 [Stegodyphus dumicola]|uniref:RAB11-binding protein RELCH homolog isoform X2 n=1 Tax=Stegodyphus dumicola TaxID=202533 RepID=UPI0015A94EEE|nr:RAB11-binding protein RELCH homolog isoform X2 [Stegodyphus dumicola]